jgi:hypothetical protein
MISPATPNHSHDNGGSSKRNDEARRHGPHPFQPLLTHLAVLRAYVGHYVAARRDMATVKARRVLLWTAAGIAAALLSLTILVVAVVLFITGVAHGLTDLFGGHAWAGEMVTGGGIVILAAAAAVIGALAWLRSSRERTVEKYEHRRAKERAEVGSDVFQRGGP